MSEQRTLQKMDDNEFLGKVDELFEWLSRQAGDGAIENWTLAGIQAEIRRRIMEGSTAVVIEPQLEKIKIEIEEIELTSAKGVHPPARTVFYNVTLFNSRFSWDERCASQAEAKKFLQGVDAAASFGLTLEKATDIFS